MFVVLVANAVKIVNSLGANKVIFLPDDYLAKYVAYQTNVEIISWKGTCEVHEKFTDTEINEIRKNNPDIKVIAHPECPPDVINASDFAGSTSGMIKYVKDNQPKKVMMVTECSMSDNIQIDNPNVEFVRPCNLCPHMKRITLPKILDCLKKETNEIVMSEEIIKRARKSCRAYGRSGQIKSVSTVKINNKFIYNTCKLALNEDLYPSGDITSNLIASKSMIKVKLISNDNGVIGGLKFVKMTFKILDKSIRFTSKVSDGSKIKKGQIIGIVKGNAKNILIGER